MKEFTLTFTGDTSFGSIYESVDESLADLIKEKIVGGSNYLITNLETVLCDNSNKVTACKKTINCDDPARTVKALKQLGVTAVSLANNHSMNYGPTELIKMKNYLEKGGIQCFGANNNLEQAIKPLEIELVGVNATKKVYIFTGLRASQRYDSEYNFLAGVDKTGVNPLNPYRICQRIKQVRDNDSDALIIVFPHWQGVEYKQISKLENIRNWCQDFVKSGADYVFGHGPHIIDEVEYTNNGTIVYSLGDFINNSHNSKQELHPSRFGLVVKLHITENDKGWEVTPNLYPLVTEFEKGKFNVRPVEKTESEEAFGILFKKGNIGVTVKREEKRNTYFYELPVISKTSDHFLSYVVPLMYNKFSKAGLLVKIDLDYVNEIQKYWLENYGRKVDVSMHLAFYNLYGRKDPRIVPGVIMRDEIIPYLNKIGKSNIYTDKNMYDKLICTSRSPKTIIKRVRGSYFSSNNDYLTAEGAWEEIIKQTDGCIIKPSTTNDGAGINKIYSVNGKTLMNEKSISIHDLEKYYGPNFIIQELIKQHPVMSTPHPSSVNTLRMVTLRWKGEIKHLLTFARFGSNGSLKDNAGAGGVCCGINDKGEFMNLVVDEHPRAHTHHPTTGYSFEDYAKIPNYEEFKTFVKDLHKQILHHDYVSWDIAVGVDGKPIFLEANFMGATWLYQLASQQPVFGDLTEEILRHIRAELDKQSSPRDYVVKF